MPFTIMKKDITRVAADAIVNPANPYPTYGGGTDAAIYRAAGAQKLLEERKQIGNIGPGNCAVTHAFDLHARYIIHTVGPAWEGGRAGEPEILANCYRNCLEAARMLKCHSIAFPLLATGVYGFPKDVALVTALSVITDFLEEGGPDHEMEVILVVFDDRSYVLPEALTEGVKAYTAAHYVPETPRQEPEEEPAPDGEDEEDEEEEKPRKRGLFGLFGRHRKKDDEEDTDDGDEELSEEPRRERETETPGRRPRPAEGQMQGMQARREDFRTLLLSMINERKIGEPQIWRRSNLTRAHFHAIESGNAPAAKPAVLALGFALQLTPRQEERLLRSAGFALLPSDRTDLAVQYCLENRIFNIVEVNAILFGAGLRQLGD